MVIAKSRKRQSRNSSAYNLIKPAIFGLIASVVITLFFIMIFAVVFVVMKSIVDSAIIPLSLFAMTVGCLIGSYICACISRERGFIYGLVIGMLLFLISYVLGMAIGGNCFGTLNIIRFVCLIVSGCLGGWLGSNHAHTKRK